MTAFFTFWGFYATICASWAVVALIEERRVTLDFELQFGGRRSLRAFQRKQSHLTLMEVILGGLLLFPLRLMATLSGCTIFFSVCAIADALARRRWLSIADSVRMKGATMRRIIPVALWCLGIRKCRHYKLRDETDAASGEAIAGPPDDVYHHLVVSNHVSCVDILANLGNFTAGYVAKEAVRSLPLIGTLATDLGSIFVDRTAHGQGLVTGSVGDRQKALFDRKDKNLLPMVIFPEGTTSNGDSVMPFRRGAFVAMYPVLPVVIVYDAPKFQLAYDILQFKWWFPLAYSSMRFSTLSYHWLPPLQADGTPTNAPRTDFGDETPTSASFAETVRRKMGRILRQVKGISQPEHKYESGWSAVEQKAEILKLLRPDGRPRIFRDM